MGKSQKSEMQLEIYINYKRADVAEFIIDSRPWPLTGTVFYHKLLKHSFEIPTEELDELIEGPGRIKQILFTYDFPNSL
jgi:hypothetical protein